MTNRNNKTVVQRYYEQFLADPSVADAIFAAAYVHGPGLSLGPNGVREERKMVLQKFGDELAVFLHSLIAEGDLVVAEVTLTGQGEGLRQIAWYRVNKGKIIERWWVGAPRLRAHSIQAGRGGRDCDRGKQDSRTPLL